MKKAVTYENGQVFQHFGHTERFKIYEVEDGAVTASQVVDTAGSGHGALAGFLRARGVQTLICGGIGVGRCLAGALPARLAGRVRDEAMLKVSLIIPLIGSLLLLAGFLCTAPLWYAVLALFVTIVPLSVMGTASFSLALSREGKYAGSASALLGFSQMILGGAMMPLVGIAGPDNPLPMAVLMLAGYTLSLLVYSTLIRSPS